MECNRCKVRDKQDVGGNTINAKYNMNSEHMVAGSEENKRQDFTINNIQGWELIMTEFEHRTWFLDVGSCEVVGMITESGTDVMGCNSCPLYEKRLGIVSVCKPYWISKSMILLVSGVSLGCSNAWQTLVYLFIGRHLPLFFFLGYYI